MLYAYQKKNINAIIQTLHRQKKKKKKEGKKERKMLVT